MDYSLPFSLSPMNLSLLTFCLRIYWLFVPHVAHVEFRGHVSGVDSLLLSCVFQGLISVCHAGWIQSVTQGGILLAMKGFIFTSQMTSKILASVDKLSNISGFSPIIMAQTKALVNVFWVDQVAVGLSGLPSSSNYSLVLGESVLDKKGMSSASNILQAA